MDNTTIWKVINKHFEDNPQSLVRHHIESYNDFLQQGLFQIFKEKKNFNFSQSSENTSFKNLDNIRKR